MLEFLLGLNIICWYGGFLLPVPSLILALREWLRTRSAPPAKAWRRKISQVALYLLVLGLVLWLYALLREWYGNYVYYNSFMARVGRWGSASLFIFCILTESKVRIYLLLGALGLLLYFAVSLGDIAI